MLDQPRTLFLALAQALTLFAFADGFRAILHSILTPLLRGGLGHFGVFAV